jgi:hypothetical protein
VLLSPYMSPADIINMLWWFERDERRTTLEVLHLAEGGFELRVLGADGVERVERFVNATDLAKRQQAIQDALVAEGWTRSGEWIL